ncbi:hypothetical protein KIN20_022450 [Parelaphostrongylus tenuis]|uniref:Uncharacterized protein n=1 Tax=Parelaphostrongylus tenuis TaxID=148309 RepID=A0AAD5MQM6_PARTN|nr:hypothetical protein KIN20_022450 [Parelaphostrongylus tenuis]
MASGVDTIIVNDSCARAKLKRNYAGAGQEERAGSRYASEKRDSDSGYTKRNRVPDANKVIAALMIKLLRGAVLQTNMNEGSTISKSKFLLRDITRQPPADYG